MPRMHAPIVASVLLQLVVLSSAYKQPIEYMDAISNFATLCVEWFTNYHIER